MRAGHCARAAVVATSARAIATPKPSHVVSPSSHANLERRITSMPQMWNIVRVYADEREPKIIRRNVTEEEAQSHCSDPETSSRTATNPTEKGNWFDSYREADK